MQVIQRLITRNFGRYRGAPTHIVLHTYDGAGRSLYSWFQNNTRKVSSHYGVFLDGGSEQYVPDNYVANQSGDSYWNRVSIGIEHQDNGHPEDSVRTPQQYQTSIQLVFELCKKWGIPVDGSHILMHRTIIKSRSCPGGLRCDYIIQEAKKLMDELLQLRAEVSSLRQLSDQSAKILELETALSSEQKESEILEALRRDFEARYVAATAENEKLKKQLEQNPKNNLITQFYEYVKQLISRSR